MTHIQNMVPLPTCLINTSVPVETARSSTNSLLVVPKIALNTFKRMMLHDGIVLLMSIMKKEQGYHYF